MLRKGYQEYVTLLIYLQSSKVDHGFIWLTRKLCNGTNAKIKQQVRHQSPLSSPFLSSPGWDSNNTAVLNVFILSQCCCAFIRIETNPSVLMHYLYLHYKHIAFVLFQISRSRNTFVERSGKRVDDLFCRLAMSHSVAWWQLLYRYMELICLFFASNMGLKYLLGRGYIFNDF